MLVATLLLACNEPETPASGVDELIENAEQGDVRGIQIGDEWIEVKAREEQNVVYSMPDELICRVPLNMKDSTFYEISYNFEEGEVYNIELDFFPQDQQEVDQLYQKFKKFYDDKYGVTTEDDKYTVWYTISSRHIDLEISMTDESMEKGRPFLNITFFEKEGIAP